MIRALALGVRATTRTCCGAPRDGTVLCPVDDTLCYVVAGQRTAGDLAVGRGVGVPALRHRGRDPASRRTSCSHPVHLRRDRSTARCSSRPGPRAHYVVIAGAPGRPAWGPRPRAQAATTPPVTVDQAAIDNAGVAGPWAHLASNPASVALTSPVYVVTMSGYTWVSWVRPVASSAVTTFQVRLRTATPTRGFTAWTVPTAWSALTSTRVAAALPPGTSACFSVRAKNRAGQLGPWSPGRCTSRPLDDRQVSALSRGWRVATSPVLYLGRVLATTQHGATWRLDGVTTARVGVVATTCPTCGSIRISLGTRVLGTISLATRTVVFQHVLLLPPFMTASGPLTITVISPNGKGIWLDGVFASRF